MGTVVLAVLMIASTAWASGATQEELPDDYLPFTFSLTDSGLVGASKFLEGFTITMDIPRNRFPEGLQLDALYSAVRDQKVTGTVTYPNGRVTPIAYEMVRHRGPEEIYMKSSLGYFLWEYISIEDEEVRMAIYWWYCPPTRPVDRTALEFATRLLADSDHWHQEDDRDCTDDAESGQWSLFCALKYASIETMGEYNHHNTAIQTVRFIIDERIPGHGFAHTLKDFNNATATTHSDILHVLELARERIEADLMGAAP